MKSERCLVIRLRDLEAVSGDRDPSSGRSEAECILRSFLDARDIPVAEERTYSDSAPDMLEALQAARDLWGDYLPPGNSNAMKAMKLVDAAIAKALGK